MEEQLEALGKGIDAGKVLCGVVVSVTFFLFIRDVAFSSWQLIP
jgi:hypothetical protein